MRQINMIILLGFVALTSAQYSGESPPSRPSYQQPSPPYRPPVYPPYNKTYSNPPTTYEPAVTYPPETTTSEPYSPYQKYPPKPTQTRPYPPYPSYPPKTTIPEVNYPPYTPEPITPYQDDKTYETETTTPYPTYNPTPTRPGLYPTYNPTPTGPGPYPTYNPTPTRPGPYPIHNPTPTRPGPYATYNPTPTRTGNPSPYPPYQNKYTPTPTPTTEGNVPGVYKCDKSRNGTKYAVLGVCFDYFECVNGESLYRECEEGYRIDEGAQKCVYDPSCITACPKEWGPDQNDITKFYIKDKQFSCDPGTYFDFRHCVCFNFPQNPTEPYTTPRVPYAAQPYL